MKKHHFLNCILFLVVLVSTISFKNREIYVFAQEISQKEYTDRLEKYWWGYRRYISNDQISKISTELDFIAAEVGILGEVTLPISFLNPIAGLLISGILEISSYYYWLVSTYLIKMNKGNGVAIDFNTGIIFRITPL